MRVVFCLLAHPPRAPDQMRRCASDAACCFLHEPDQTPYTDTTHRSLPRQKPDVFFSQAASPSKASAKPKMQGQACLVAVAFFAASGAAFHLQPRMPAVPISSQLRSQATTSYGMLSSAFLLPASSRCVSVWQVLRSWMTSLNEAK